MKNKYNKILVIGSNSFSGSNFINCTLSKPTKIIGISRSKEYRKIKFVDVVGNSSRVFSIF